MKATIVSLIPWETPPETKPGMIPDTYKIPKSDGKTPAVLVIEDAITNIYMGAERGTFPSPIPVDQLAESIVKDASNSYLEIEPEAKPAIFWVEGSLSPKEIMDKHPDKVSEALKRQNRWFMKLIRTGDDTWARFHQHRMISGIQRAAAKHLGLTKEWAVDPEPINLIPCPACRTMIDTTAIVCRNCKAILKPEEAKKLGINFAA